MIILLLIQYFAKHIDDLTLARLDKMLNVEPDGSKLFDILKVLKFPKECFKKLTLKKSADDKKACEKDFYANSYFFCN